jgi:uridylate kinase
MNNNHIVISVGGSMIFPKDIDKEFLKSFVSMIYGYLDKGFTFTLFTGGGSIARDYIEAASSFKEISTDERDWLGISLTRANAQLLKTLFGKDAYEKVLHDPNVDFETEKKVIIGAGWKPGFSTDNDAVLYAKKYGMKKVINLSNIDFVYTKDPRKYTDAVKIEKVDWKTYRSLIPDTWEAGLHSPFDPIASREAEEGNIDVLIINGHNLEEVKNAIEGKSFLGTHIFSN